MQVRATGSQIPVKRDVWLTSIMKMACWAVCDPLESQQTLAGVAAGGFVSARCGSQDLLGLRYLVDLSFQVIDTSLILALDSKRHEGPVVSGRGSQLRGVVIDRASTSEAERVGEIADAALVTSRFHLDPLISNQTARRIKKEWARNLALGSRGTHCLVAREGDRVIGFVGVNRTTGDRPALVIDLVAVAPFAQGRGVGRMLVDEVAREARAVGVPVRVGTQAANIAAVAFYESLGFCLVESHYVLHAHWKAGI